jgi:hypothetical protein
VNTLQMIQNGRIPPGKYQVPFDIELPDYLPASLSVVSGRNVCKINYNLKAVLKGSGTFYNYNCDRTVTIKAKPMTQKELQEPVPFEGQPVVQDIYFLCCLNRGSVTLGARLENTVLSKSGDPVTLSVECRNNATVQIKEITAELTQQVRWTAKGHSGWRNHKLAKLTFNQSQMRNFQPTTQALLRGDSVRQQGDQMLRELRDGAHNQPLAILPGPALASYQGGVMSIEHKLKITMMTGACVTNPEIVIPVRVVETGTSGASNSSAPPAPPPTESAFVPSYFAGDDVISAETIKVHSNPYSTGGTVVEGGTDEEIAVWPFSTTSSEAQPASMDKLLTEMKYSVGDLEIVKRYIDDPDWKYLFKSITPSQYAEILKKVDSDFDQPAVAVLIAEHTSNFTCQHVVSAIHITSDWNRATFVEKLFKLCKDSTTNSNVIKQELTDWEKTVTARVFD